MSHVFGVVWFGLTRVLISDFLVLILSFDVFFFYCLVRHFNQIFLDTAEKPKNVALDQRKQELKLWEGDGTQKVLQNKWVEHSRAIASKDSTELG